MRTEHLFFWTPGATAHTLCNDLAGVQETAWAERPGSAAGQSLCVPTEREGQWRRRNADGYVVILMSESVFDRVAELLKQAGVVFDVLRHEPVYTSEQAAQVRGTSLASGAKALVCKGEDAFVMFVVPADRRLASKAIRRERGWRKLRFATRDEVEHLTGLAPGSIPPSNSSR